MTKSKARREREAKEKREALIGGGSQTDPNVASQTPKVPDTAKPDSRSPDSVSTGREVRNHVRNTVSNTPPPLRETTLKLQGADLVISFDNEAKTFKALSTVLGVIRNASDLPQTLIDEINTLERLIFERFSYDSEVQIRFASLLEEYDVLYDSKIQERPENYDEEVLAFLKVDPGQFAETLRQFRNMGEGGNGRGARDRFRGKRWENRDFRRIIRFNKSLRQIEHLGRGQKERYWKAVDSLNTILRVIKGEIDWDTDVSEGVKRDWKENYVGFQQVDFEFLLQALDRTRKRPYTETRQTDEITEAEQARADFLTDTEDTVGGLTTALNSIEAAAKGESDNQDTFAFWAEPDYDFTRNKLKQRLREVLEDKLQTIFLDDLANRCEQDSDAIKKRLEGLIKISKFKVDSDTKSNQKRIIDYAKKVLYVMLPQAILNKTKEKGPKREDKGEVTPVLVQTLENLPFGEPLDEAVRNLRGFFKGNEGKNITLALNEFSQIFNDPSLSITDNFSQTQSGSPQGSIIQPSAAPVTPTILKTPEETRDEDFRRLLENHPLLPTFNQVILDLKVVRDEERIKERQSRLRAELERIAAINDENQRRAELITLLTPSISSNVSILRGFLKQ